MFRKKKEAKFNTSNGRNGKTANRLKRQTFFFHEVLKLTKE